MYILPNGYDILIYDYEYIIYWNNAFKNKKPLKELGID